jgi:hypothetical protein
MEFQAIELVLQLPYRSDVSIHLLVVTIPIFIDLSDNQGGVTVQNESFDAELYGDTEAVDYRFVLGGVVGGPKVDSKDIAQLVPGW